MSRIKNKPTNIEALDQVETAVNRVVGLIRAVLAKYPQETIAPELLPFVQRFADHAVRRSRRPLNGGRTSDPRKDEIVLTFTSFFSSKNTTLRFPLALLEAPEQEITRWARDQYWSAIATMKREAHLAARRKAENAEKVLKKAQREHETALQELATISAAGNRTRPRTDRGARA